MMDLLASFCVFLSPGKMSLCAPSPGCMENRRGEKGGANWGAGKAGALLTALQGYTPHTQGELSHLPGLEELMVLRMLRPLGRCRICPPPALELGTVRGSLLWDSEGLSVMQLFTGSIPQAEPLIYSTGRAPTRGCVYLKNPIPKLSVPNWGLSPPSYPAIPSLPLSSRGPWSFPSLLPK